MAWDTPLGRLAWDKGELGGPDPVVDFVLAWAAQRSSCQPIVALDVTVGLLDPLEAWATVTCALEALFGYDEVTSPPAPQRPFRPIDGAIY